MPRKRCLVTRYGALGDSILAASTLPLLKREGYHITYNTTPMGYELLKADPHIDAFMIQDVDQVPNQELSPYWESLRREGRWDRIINLCESIEGALLKTPGHLDHLYSDEARRRLVGHKSYFEQTHDIAGVAREYDGRFYATPDEAVWSLGAIGALRGKERRPVVTLAMTGSSVHKIYPWWHVVMAWVLERTDAAVVICSDADHGKYMQDALIEQVGAKLPGEMGRIHARAGVWDIRQAMAAVQNVDVLVGPETGLLWSVASLERVRKVVMLSHSSRENFCPGWKNLWALEAVSTPCFPCHRLHSAVNKFEFCHQDPNTKAALCAANIDPKRVYQAITAVIGERPAAAAE